MQGIKVGHGAIIGSKSLVTKDIEPYAVIGGNPARVIKKRFDDNTIQFLLKLKWWDWGIEKITENIHAITMGDFNYLKSIL